MLGVVVVDVVVVIHGVDGVATDEYTVVDVAVGIDKDVGCGYDDPCVFIVSAILSCFPFLLYGVAICRVMFGVSVVSYDGVS